ncbi:MAG: hypothetical protein ABI780_13425 [Ardenticatenales bacterium]
MIPPRLASLAAIGLTLGAAACARPDGASMTLRTGRAPSAWLVARTDGAVERLDADGTSATVLASWAGRRPAGAVDPSEKLGAPVIAIDPLARRLWHSDTHAGIASIDLDTGAPGPSLTNFTDTAIPGCGVSASGREFAVDPLRRVLYAPMLTGLVLAYDLDTLDVRGSIPAAAFTDLALGRYRMLAVDPGGELWVLDAAGNAHAYDPDRAVATGRVVAAAATDLAVDAGRGLLLLREGAAVRAVSLATLGAVDIVVPTVGRGEQAVPVADVEAGGGPSTTRAGWAPRPWR